VDLGATFEADAQSSLLVEPGDRPLDDPAMDPESTAVLSVPSRQEGLDRPESQTDAMWLRVVAAIRVHAMRTEPRSAARSPQARDVVDQREELIDV
jgi:hypothetical protein